MPDILRKILFSEALLGAVADFDCGNEGWEKPLAEWVKAGPKVRNGALYEIKKRKGKLQVWPHINQADELVGYSSLGESSWEWPLPDDPRVPVSIIPNVAIQRRFWGKPDDPPRYSRQIFDHLVFEARTHTGRHPLLGLYVDPRNVRAIKAYHNAGFTDFHRHYQDEGIEYVSMILKLAEYGGGGRSSTSTA
jgi:hypothetical protein